MAGSRPSWTPTDDLIDELTMRKGDKTRECVVTAFAM
jgi:hypothetical protein